MSSDRPAGAIWANPYTLRVNKSAPFGLQICYSYAHRFIAPLTNGTVKFYTHNLTNDLMLSGKELTSNVHEFSEMNEFGIVLRIQVAAGYMESHLVSGMAFVTSKYAGITPLLISENNITGFRREHEKFIIDFDTKQTWVLYFFGGDISFAQKDKHTLVADKPYHGIIRVAVLPQNAPTNTYDACAGCIVQGGRMDAFSEYEYTFEWDVVGATCMKTGLLHFSLPHHRDVLIRDTVSDSQINLFSTVRGQMVGHIGIPVKGSSSVLWNMRETGALSRVGFTSDCSILSRDVANTKLLAQLKKDIDADCEFVSDGQRFQNCGNDKTLLKKCLTKLKMLLKPFIINNISFPLVYDTVHGGVISSEGFVSKDPFANFGNTLYNDHHFHYSYYVYTAAVLKMLDPEYPPEFDEMIWSLLRDYVNPSHKDPFFPPFRSFSVFNSISYAHGVTYLEEGKDQESSSKDLNSLYALRLWGLATKRENVEKLGYLLLQINARAINTYYLIKSGSTIHPAEFSKNHVVGIYFDNKCDYRTWFSPDLYTNHGINMIPATALLARARSLEFVRQEWNDILSKQKIIVERDLNNPWMSLLYVNYARLDRKAALDILQVCAMDDGLSRSWAIYMADTSSDNSCEEPRGR